MEIPRRAFETTGALSTTVIRQYKQSDRNAVRRICAGTALYGRPVGSFASDPEFIVDGLLLYYTEFEPESLFVAENSGGVIGYLAGCVSTQRFDYMTVRYIAPRLAFRFFTQGICFHAWAWQLIAALAHVWIYRRASLGRALSAYPAHCHVNMDPAYRRAGAGAALCETFIGYLRSRGVKGIHISSPTEAGKRFFAKRGFELLATHPAPVLAGISPGEIWLMGKLL